jgi:hypothetical protein
MAPINIYSYVQNKHTNPFTEVIGSRLHSTTQFLGCILILISIYAPVFPEFFNLSAFC